MLKIPKQYKSLKYIHNIKKNASSDSVGDDERR